MVKFQKGQGVKLRPLDGAQYSAKIVGPAAQCELHDCPTWLCTVLLIRSGQENVLDFCETVIEALP